MSKNSVPLRWFALHHPDPCACPALQAPSTFESVAAQSPRQRRAQCVLTPSTRRPSGCTNIDVDTAHTSTASKIVTDAVPAERCHLIFRPTKLDGGCWRIPLMCPTRAKPLGRFYSFPNWSLHVQLCNTRGRYLKRAQYATNLIMTPRR
jgi:hypothetical protein